MKKYIFLLLITMVTFVSFSRPVDRPPDIEKSGMELTQVILPEIDYSIEIEKSITYLTIVLEPEKKSDNSPTCKIESEALEPSISERYTKIAGTENRQYGNHDNTLNSATNGNHLLTNEILPEYANKVQPRIRSPVS